MKKKLHYEAPATQALELAPGGAILTGSTEYSGGGISNPSGKKSITSVAYAGTFPSLYILIV